ncbi:type 1 glutamine amidotransferase [candidate division KSB1 bacterium]
MPKTESKLIRVHYLQHDDFVRPAETDTWARQKGHPVTRSKLLPDRDGLRHEANTFPDPASFDLLIIFGGTMSTYDDKEFRWLTNEKKFVERTVQSGKAVYGICMGAQMLAAVLGANVYRNRYKEVGWHEVTLTPEAARSQVFGILPDRFMAMHWHGDVFDIPRDCTRIAFSEATPNQAFEYDSRIFATQFHPEYNLQSVEEGIQYTPEDLNCSAYAQSAEEILKNRHYFPAMHEKLFTILDGIETVVLSLK